MPETYHFVTDWGFGAPLQKVWSVVLDIERYPAWWKNFRHVTITRGDGKSVGSVIECEVRGSSPYRLKYALEVKEADQYRGASAARGELRASRGLPAAPRRRSRASPGRRSAAW